MLSKKSSLILALLFSLWILKDEDSSNHFAVQTALQRHPPSKRVFRALFGVFLILLGAAFSIYVWVQAVGAFVVGQLLFRKPRQHEAGYASIRGRYQKLSTNDGVDEGETEEWSEEGVDEGNQEKPVLAVDEAMDADYASDGEVDQGLAEKSLPATNDNDLPPDPGMLAGAALDLLLLVLVSLFLFTLSSAEGGKYIEGMANLSAFQITANVAAPIFPLLLFLFAFSMIIFPWSKRKDLWIVLFYTIGAPFYDVTFRDGFVGDVLTSSVRPLQDIAFTLFYILSGLQGWWTQSYDLDDAALPVERSWWVRTVILPACMVSPLWWRFNQNLRQTFDSKKRWPYLGNALKYLAAAEVAMFGVFNPVRKTSPVWLFCAVVATLYQVWWDIFMDWDLLVFSGGKIRLREKRLYQSTSMYWFILLVNFVLRFGWTWTFFPVQYLDQTGGLKTTFQGIFAYIDPLLASAEIIRRTMWGFIRLELEAITKYSDQPKVKERLRQCSKVTGEKVGDVELQPMSDTNDATSSVLQDGVPSVVTRQGFQLSLISDMSARNDLQVLLELGLWTAVFAGGGILAAAHRGTY